MSRGGSLSPQQRQYALITGNYWAFTLTDGALRMLVVLHFYQLGYRPLEVALLFLFYELFGVITNLFGGWLAARAGLNTTLHIGLGLQVLALCMLLVPATMLSVPLVMAAQAVSGIAKDLNKLSAKSAIRALLPSSATGRLYRWIAVLTGSKNTLKGVGFFLGGLLLAWCGFRGALAVMALALALVWVTSLFSLRGDLGKARVKPKLRHLFAKSRAVNILSAARLCLFAARDVWFVVALPVYLSATLGWQHWAVGAFMALWVIGYGVVQSLAPAITGRSGGGPPDGRAATYWALMLTPVPAAIALALGNGTASAVILVAGLLVFGALFAINSALHSFLIVSYADADGVSLDVGFYYMANAIGRLLGTVLSGWVYQSWGLAACLWVATGLVGGSALVSLGLPYRSDRASAGV